MIILTNEDNPNTLKLIIAAKLAKEPFVVQIVNPGSKSINLLSISYFAVYNRFSVA